MEFEPLEEIISRAAGVPVALSTDLPETGVMRALIGSGAEPLDLVVWRSRSGHVSAFNNRCPHRGMRLSFGFVRGERLSCIYHGWQYGEDGGCRHIPAHPDMTPPASISADTYSCHDHDGVIWISDAADKPADKPANLPVFGGQGLRSLPVNRSEHVLRKMLIDSLLPVSDDNRIERAETSVITENESSLILEAKAGAANLRLMAHFQPLNIEKTMLHIQTSPGLSVDHRISLSRWAEHFRWSAENLGTLTNSWDDSPAELRS